MPFLLLALFLIQGNVQAGENNPANSELELVVGEGAFGGLGLLAAYSENMTHNDSILHVKNKEKWDKALRRHSEKVQDLTELRNRKEIDLPAFNYKQKEYNDELSKTFKELLAQGHYLDVGNRNRELALAKEILKNARLGRVRLTQYLQRLSGVVGFALLCDDAVRVAMLLVGDDPGLVAIPNFTGLAYRRINQRLRDREEGPSINVQEAPKKDSSPK